LKELPFFYKNKPNHLTALLNEIQEKYMTRIKITPIYESIPDLNEP